MLTSQLVRNHLTEQQIESASVIDIHRESESVLIRVEEYHNRKQCYNWVMLSYDTGQHSILTFEKEMCERVSEHWKGFKANVKVKHDAFVNSLANN